MQKWELFFKYISHACILTQNMVLSLKCETFTVCCKRKLESRSPASSLVISSVWADDDDDDEWSNYS